MRELLFRGFHPCDGPDTIVVDGEKANGRWVEGYVVKHPSAIQIGGDYSPWYIHVPPVDPDDNGGVFNVLPSTVGQYIGLTDRTGERIFEGDKVKGFNDLHQREEEYIVVWACNNGFYFVDDSETEWHPEHIVPCEVIGTVFDDYEKKLIPAVALQPGSMLNGQNKTPLDWPPNAPLS